MVCEPLAGAASTGARELSGSPDRTSSIVCVPSRTRRRHRHWPGVNSNGISRLPATAAELDPALAVKGEYDTVTTFEQLDAWIARLRAAGTFALDTETDSLDPLQANLIGLSFSDAPGQAAYVPLGHDYPGAPAQLDRQQALDRLAPLLADP
ncbi:DNA polymerase I, partial [Xanthomonas sp. Kuri4-3]